MTLSSVIFVGVMLFAFGFAVGNARKLEPGKIIVLMIVLAMLINQFAKNDSYTAVMMIGFVAGFLLPYLPDMDGIGERLSEIINQVRYRDAYEDIKRKEEEVEALREELLRERQRQNAEATRERRERQRAEGEARREQAEQGQKQRESRKEQASGQSRRQRTSSNPRVEKTEEPKAKRSDKQQSAKDPSAGQRQRKRNQQSQNSQRSQNNQRQSRSRAQSSSQSSSSQSTARKPTGIRAGHLETLGLDPAGEYTYADIKKAYRRMAVKYHPDKHQTKSQQVIDEMTERFKAVQLAYQWLAANTEL